MKKLSLYINNINFILVIALIIITVITICMFVNFSQKNHKKHIIASVVVFMLNCLNLASLFELDRAYQYQNIESLNPISRFISNLPIFVQYIFFLANIIFIFYEVYIILSVFKKNFPINVVREAIENLTTGLAFYDEKGFLYLSNRIMHKLSIELTKKDLQNGLELQNDIKELQSSDVCIIKEEPSFVLPNKKIWQFSKSMIEIEGKTFTELRADDITEIYHLSDEIRNVNENLKQEKIRLAKHMKNIDKYISEEETLRVKMAVHDDFGELIARTVRTYEQKASKEEKSALITAWSKLGNRINRILTIDDEDKNTFEKIISLAKELNCRIKLVGELPKDNIQSEIIISAIFEALKNAVYHAKADEVIITIINERNKIITTIYNEEKSNLTHINEGGGLTSIRERVEKTGGVMEIICNKGITVCVTLYKEMSANV